MPTFPPSVTVAPDPSPWWRDAVCYEIFVRSFFDSNGDGAGDIPGLIDKLDYLNDGKPGGADLGVICVWLMPIMDSPSYHGYDIVDYTRVDREYGTDDDLRHFVDAAHQRGVRVLLDLPLNHTSRTHPWFQDALTNPASPYRDWYIWSATDPGYSGSYGQAVWHLAPETGEFYYATFGDGMPDLNYHNPAVTAEAYRISALWLERFGIDGFRLDAIKHLIEDGQIQEDSAATHAWMRDYRAYLDTVSPNAYTVGEVFGGSTVSLSSYYPDQLHAFFHFDLAGQILTGAASGNASGVVTIATDAADQIPDHRFATFLSNHDQTRAMTTLNNDVAAAKVAATLLLTLPGTPFIYYGEEIGVTGTKPDPNLRAPMPWTSSANGGFSSGEPWERFADDPSRLSVAQQLGDPASLLNHYRALIALRASHDALSRGDFVPLRARPRSLSAFVRQSETETLLVVVNAGPDMVSDSRVFTGESPLEPGRYAAFPVLGSNIGRVLTVGANGSIDDYSPLGALAPGTAYVFRLVTLPGADG